MSLLFNLLMIMRGLNVNLKQCEGVYLVPRVSSCTLVPANICCCIGTSSDPRDQVCFGQVLARVSFLDSHEFSSIASLVEAGGYSLQVVFKFVCLNFVFEEANNAAFPEL
jgi:hypothetical protein